MAKKLNCPSESFLVPRQHRIKAIQELYNAVNEVYSGSGSAPDGQVQSDWNQSDSTKDDYIKNKPTIPSITNKANKITIVNYGTSSTTTTLSENTYYIWGEVASLTLTLGTPADASKLSEYMFEFQSGATPTTLSLPSSVKWVDTPTIEANKTYQVSIVNDIAIIVGV